MKVSGRKLVPCPRITFYCEKFKLGLSHEIYAQNK
jgi:hypothetical protein